MYSVIAAPACERHVSTVRRHAAACLHAWCLAKDDQHCSLLIVGELAGNAAVHGRDTMTLGLALAAADRTLCIQVTDYGGPPRATLRASLDDLDEEFGRGLGIVCSLAQSVDSITTVNSTQVRAIYRIEALRAT
ncbi:ATP-binding protein [Streptomyces sp. A3M-1-3]|uniref:ATP-binding protein n=1 Tax=Streptomyces sp. A3M-1-3 TaxID=2962044 RepID=UPI0020B69640|nr:ATP-binding protein [Streptomyces sp. A3M-1-3]MCP3820664.1 ATP-binding protein [Streptomyces sp. A3M-1-3]